MQMRNLIFRARLLRGLMALVVVSAHSGCVSIPAGVQAVRPFDAGRYAGRWYEMARLDFRYERNLVDVTAEYTIKEDGGIRVRNRGWDTTTGKWKESIGKARSVDDPGEGRLKVSFFGPFYAGYNVVALDSGYRYAMVMGDDLDNMWILSRAPELPEAVRDAYVGRAASVGYDTSALVWTPHGRAPR